MGLLVQLILGGALLAILGLACIIFAKSLGDKKTLTSVIPQFLLVEFLLVLSAAGIITLARGLPKDGGEIPMLVCASIGVGMLLNLPAAIVGKILSLFFKKEHAEEQDEKTSESEGARE